MPLIVLLIACSSEPRETATPATRDSATLVARDSGSGSLAGKDSVIAGTGGQRTGTLRVTVAQPTPPSSAPAKPAPPVVESKPFRGYYRRNSDSVLFQPCGDPKYYQAVGSWEALNALRERYRFSAIYAGRPMFAAVQGHFVEDTLRATSPVGSAAPSLRVVRRFHVAKFDTLRARAEGDCRGSGTSSKGR